VQGFCLGAAAEPAGGRRIACDELRVRNCLVRGSRKCTQAAGLHKRIMECTSLLVLSGAAAGGVLIGPARCARGQRQSFRTPERGDQASGR